MASPSPTTIHRSSLSPHHPSSSPLHRLSTFKDPSTTVTTTATSQPQNPLSSFSTHPLFSLFLSPDFSSTHFSSQALSSGSAASTAELLQDGIRLLQSQLRSDVITHHDTLFSQLSSLRAAESSLSLIRSSVASLQGSVRRVRAEISDPNAQIKVKTRQLSNLHDTSLHLQTTIRVLRLIKKLRDVMEVENDEGLDLLKGAQLHCEIIALASSDHDLSGIEVIDEELRWVSEAGSRLRAQGMKVLDRGLEGFNQAEVGSGLQVFYNLGELRGTVDGLVVKYENLGVKSVNFALNMKAISGGGGGGGPGGIRRSGTPEIGGSGKAKDGLWQRMSGCMDQLHSIIVAVWHLQRVLSKKRDPFTHVLLLDEVIQVCVLFCYSFCFD